MGETGRHGFVALDTYVSLPTCPPLLMSSAARGPDASPPSSPGGAPPKVNPREAAEEAECPLGKMGVMSELVATLPCWEASGWKL